MSIDKLGCLQYLVVFLSGFVTAYLLTPFIRTLAIRLAIVDNPGDRKIHAYPIARCGGIAVFAGFHVACGLVFVFFPVPAGALISTRWWLYFAVASSVLLVVGLVDDCRGLSPLIKIAGQLVAGTILWAFGIGVSHFLNMDLPWFIDFVITMVWLLAVTNAFNLIDGIDGLATGLGIIAAIGIGGALLFRGYPHDVLILVGFVGAGAAFLRYNFHPATIFLGDSGSMFLGFTLAAIALQTGSKGAATASIGVPLMAVGIPIFDVMLAVWRRSARSFLPAKLRQNNNGSGITEADSEHLHHRLIRQGLSQKQVASLLYAFNILLVAIALLSLVQRSLAAGLYLLAFAGGSYVVVRHLATVELWDSALGILSGLSRPSRKTIAVITYPLVDVLILCGCWFVVMYVVPENVDGVHSWAKDFLSSMPVWVGIPFLAIVMSRAYRRVWSRARAMDFVILVWAILFGIFVALGMDALLSGKCSRQMIIAALTYSVLCISMFVGVRAFFVCIRDAMTLLGQAEAHRGIGARKKIIIYGGGMNCAYFLKSRHDSIVRNPHAAVICGIIDDDSNLRGRLVCSCPVLGGLADLPDLAKKVKPDEILVTVALDAVKKQQLLNWARQESVVVSEWTMERRILQDAASQKQEYLK
ncbi:MAG: hypothetical protein PHR77_11185 [Kiritimatiellae bacterium]|nr:hypothetical protein [Kiritimatiellia bacterium]MDD5521710.1 hypothetical protein [Kiritimatiellia bacterium]